MIFLWEIETLKFHILEIWEGLKADSIFWRVQKVWGQNRYNLFYSYPEETVLDFFLKRRFTTSKRTFEPTVPSLSNLNGRTKKNLVILIFSDLYVFKTFFKHRIFNFSWSFRQRIFSWTVHSESSAEDSGS